MISIFNFFWLKAQRFKIFLFTGNLDDGPPSMPPNVWNYFCVRIFLLYVVVSAAYTFLFCPFIFNGLQPTFKTKTCLCCLKYVCCFARVTNGFRLHFLCDHHLYLNICYLYLNLMKNIHLKVKVVHGC